MLVLEGRVVNVAHKPARTTKDGEIIPATTHVQILGGLPGAQMDLFNLKTDRGTAFEAAQGKIVRCPVRPYAFAGDGGGIIAGLSMVQGAQILLVDDKGGTSSLPEPKKAVA